MASGKNHDAAIVISTPVAAYLSYETLGDLRLSIFFGASYLIGGLFLSPDLDLPYSNPSRKWGHLRWVWSIYAKSIPHRHFLSHGPVIGSFVRIAYLNLWLLPAWILVWQQPAYKAILQSELFVRFVLIFFLAVEASAWNHLLMDGLIIPFPKGVKNFLAGYKSNEYSPRRSATARKIRFRSHRK